MPMQTIKKAMYNFFNPAKASSELHSSLVEQRVRIKELKNEYRALSRWNHEYVSTLSLLTEAMQALIWKKDKNHRYILANPMHCMSFFGYKEGLKCLDTIKGQTDIELIETNFISKGIQNTFPEACTLSDIYCSGKIEPCHFLETGIVDGKKILFYTIKTPQFAHTGEFTGSIGLAWDMTNQSEFLTTELNRWIYSKKALKLYDENGTFSYTITPELRQCAIFHHICPVPERGKQCDGRCSVCAKVLTK